jgi:cytochrome b561
VSAAQDTRYGSAAIAIHWLTAVLVVAAYVMGPGGTEQRVYAPANDLDREIHEAIGLAVLALTLLRLAWRAYAPPPRLPSPTLWMLRLSKLVHGLLYALLLAAPLTAIAGAWLEGHPLTLGILGNVLPLIPENHALGESVAKVHTILGDTIVWLAGFHAAAALFHHFFLRDTVLAAMLPARFSRR